MSDKKDVCIGQDDMDVVIEAGKILMESGAEIYRIEETMSHMAATLKIEDFDTYVVNHEIIASGTNRDGIKEAKVTGISETKVHLGKLEAVNSLSREIEQRENVTSEEIASRLESIRKIPDSSVWINLPAYFVGAGCFAFAIGSSVMDSVWSALSGLIMGLVLQLVGKYIRSNVILTIIGSAVVTLSANFLCLFGLGQNRTLIILGTLMLIVPGAEFTNSVREFSQNNYATGLMLLMSALLACLSIGVGVAVVTELLPFAEQMSNSFSSTVTSFWEIIPRTLAVGVGTIAFSFLFHAPKKYFVDLGILGAVSWFLYLTMDMFFGREIISIFIPALFATFSSWIFSVKRRCPMTIFLSTSIFPLIPGLSFFRAVYFLMTGDSSLAWTYMRSCFISAFTIALAIIIIQELRYHKKFKKFVK